VLSPAARDDAHGGLGAVMFPAGSVMFLITS
jgi:hypothetical protein